RVERLRAGLRPPVQPGPLEVLLVRLRTVPLLGDATQVRPGGHRRPGRLTHSLDPVLELREVVGLARGRVVRAGLAVEVEELRLGDLALRDELGLVLVLLGDRALAGLAGRRRAERPRVV